MNQSINLQYFTVPKLSKMFVFMGHKCRYMMGGRKGDRNMM